MSIDWNGIIKTAEGELAKALTARVMANIALGAFSFLSPLVSFGIGLVVGLLVKYGDWLAYMVLDDWKNTSEGKAYQDAALKNSTTPADSPDKAAAIAAQKAAFNALLGAS